VSDRPLPNSNFSRQAAKRLRRRLARRLLNETYQVYLRDSANNKCSHPTNLLATPESTESVPQSANSPSLSLHINLLYFHVQSYFHQENSPHSVLTIKKRLDTPPSTPSVSSLSYSPVHFPENSPRPTSLANSTTSSVEIVDEIPIPPSRPRQYYYYDSYNPSKH